jgi:hypothetical protein
LRSIQFHRHRAGQPPLPMRRWQPGARRVIPIPVRRKHAAGPRRK